MYLGFLERRIPQYYLITKKSLVYLETKHSFRLFYIPQKLRIRESAKVLSTPGLEREHKKTVMFCLVRKWTYGFSTRY